MCVALIFYDGARKVQSARLHCKVHVAWRFEEGVKYTKPATFELLTGMAIIFLLYNIDLIMPCTTTRWKPSQALDICSVDTLHLVRPLLNKTRALTKLRGRVSTDPPDIRALTGALRGQLHQQSDQPHQTTFQTYVSRKSRKLVAEYKAVATFMMLA